MSLLSLLKVLSEHLEQQLVPWRWNEADTNHDVVMVIAGAVHCFDAGNLRIPLQVYRVDDHSSHWQHSGHHAEHQRQPQLGKKKAKSEDVLLIHIVAGTLEDAELIHGAVLALN